VYFGGGTPSLLTPTQLGGLLAAIPRQPGAEVTVECNPETVDESKLRGFRQAGATRLSFGVQSMVLHVLQSLGREHDVGAVRRAIEAAAASGFAEAFSVDLIYGAAGESVDDWRATLDAVLALEPAPAHVSAYGLTVEAGTPLARDLARHPDPDDQADKYAIADERLGTAGLEWYELSNWAHPGAECRHNQLYWEQGLYRGIGCAAHSHAVRPDGSVRRWWNIRTPERYISAIDSGQPAEAAGEDLAPGEREMEALQLAVRTRRGVPREALPAWPDDDGLRPLLASDPEGRRLTLTRDGRLLANEVILRLTPCEAESGSTAPR
jgi:oxygen-independent coproporphyrinogen-3 oxidase